MKKPSKRKAKIYFITTNYTSCNDGLTTYVFLEAHKTLERAKAYNVRRRKIIKVVEVLPKPRGAK